MSNCPICTINPVAPGVPACSPCVINSADEGPHQEMQSLVDYLERADYDAEPPFYDPDEIEFF